MTHSFPTRRAAYLEAGGGVGEQPQATQRRLALDARGDVVGEGDDLIGGAEHELTRVQDERLVALGLDRPGQVALVCRRVDVRIARSEEHTSELQSLMRISYAVFCLTKKKKN